MSKCIFGIEERCEECRMCGSLRQNSEKQRKSRNMERLTERAEINKCPGIWVKEGFANKDVKTWFNGYDNGYSAINKLADYEDLEEQKRLIKLPCAVGDTVWYISEKIERHGRKNVTVKFIEKGTVDNITFGMLMIPQITVCNDENVWTTFDYDEHTDRDFFLAKEEAESALKILTELERAGIMDKAISAADMTKD